jgi:serine/threonine protein kinase
VKPSNIFFAAQYDGSFRLKLIDFGITRVSPEGAMGAHVDVRADVYGAALVLYTMLAGRGPFDHVRGAEHLREAHVRERPEPPSHFARDPVPAELDALVLRALEKDPAARFATATELRTRLGEVAELLARPPGWRETRSFARPRAPEPAPKPTSKPSNQFATLPRPITRAGVPAWLLFAAGVVIAALAVAALGGLFGASP